MEAQERARAGKSFACRRSFRCNKVLAAEAVGHSMTAEHWLRVMSWLMSGRQSIIAEQSRHCPMPKLSAICRVGSVRQVPSLSTLQVSALGAGRSKAEAAHCLTGSIMARSLPKLLCRRPVAGAVVCMLSN